MNELAKLRALSQYFEDKGDYAEAELSMQKCLLIQEENGYVESLELADDLYGIGMLNLALDNSEHANLYLLRALEIRMKELPRNHNDIADVLEALSYVDQLDECLSA